jgi:hypothetical protein
MNVAQSSTGSPSDDVVVEMLKEEELPYFDGVVFVTAILFVVC